MATNVLSSLIGVDPTITKYFRSPEGRREKQEGLSPRSSIFTDANNESRHEVEIILHTKFLKFVNGDVRPCV